MSANLTSALPVGQYIILSNSAVSSQGVTYRVIDQTAGKLTINPAALTITYTADPFSRFYGAANPAFTGTQTATGLVNGDTLAGVTSGTASYTTTATTGSNVGSYAVNGSGLSANSANYSFTFAQAAGNATALTINPAPLTITYTADPFSRFYGAANPAFTGTQSATGLVNGDTLAGVTTGAANYSTIAAVGSNIGSYAINGSGLVANSGNYNFTFAQAAGNATALTINPASLTVVADPISRTYGANNPALTYVSTGLVNGDALSGALATKATSASSVGIYNITQGSLAASSNYALSFTGASLTINPAALTITYNADPFSRFYGAANPAFTGTQTTSGLVNGDTLAGVTTGTASYSSVATSGSNVGSYAINGGGLTANSGNYNFTFAQAAGNATALTVNPAALTVTYTADPFSRLYGAANPALTGSQSATGLVNGDTLAGVTTGIASYTTAARAASNVGSYAINGSGLSANSGNYNFTFAQAAGNATALTINPASLTVTYTADPFSRLYGAANPALTGTQSATGLVNGDTLAGVTAGTASYTTTATSGSNVGSYAINGGGLTANSGNYNFTFAQAAGNATALTINPAALTVTYTADPFSRLYGAANPALTGSQSATGLVNGDTLAGVTTGSASYVTAATSGSNVGSYAITGSGLAANSSNYSFTFAQAAGNATALTINPASLTITYTADPFSRFYGAANPTFTGTQSATGLVNGDTLAGVTSGTASYATTATIGSNIGSYAINGSGLTANSGNYNFTFAQAAGNATALTINPALLMVVADPLARLYGAANPTLTYVATGLVNGDTLSGNLATSATATSSVGAYGITQGTLAASNNYTLSFTGALLTINPAALTVVADPLSRIYGAANPTLTYVTTGLVNGDSLSGMLATSATSSSSVGAYGITQGTLTASSNYVLSFTGAMLTINPATLTVTYAADPFSRLYGAANPALTGTQSATGLVNGDTLAGVTTGTASYATVATSGSNVGSYAINGSGLIANSGNYNFTFAQAVGNATALTINPAALTVTYTADPFSRFYGAANPAFTGTQSATGLVNGDTLAGVTSGTASYATSATAGSNIGSYAVNGNGLVANSGNYSFTFAQAAGNATALTINPAALMVVANPLSRTYDAANPALTYVTTGLVNGDMLSGNLATSATTASSVGTYGITQGTLAASSNYALSFTGAMLTINPAALTITYTADPFSRIYGVANPTFTGTQSATGLVNGDTLANVTTGTANYATTATTGSNVGSYAINGSGLSANSANYSFTFTQAAGNATALKITPRSLSVTADPISRQFGAPNPPLTYVIAPTTATSGLVNGDVLTGALSTTATQLSPSGDYAILQGSLMASSNYIFNYTGANLTIELPPLQSLSSFVPVPGAGQAVDQTEPKGCTSDELSAQLREKGKANPGGGAGDASCS